MAMDLKEIESLIKEALADAKVEIQDLAGDGNHYSATVTSAFPPFVRGLYDICSMLPLLMLCIEASM